MSNSKNRTIYNMSWFKHKILDDSTLNAQTPHLNKIGKTNPFMTPEGYFESFQQSIMQQVQFIPQANPVQTFFKNIGSSVLQPQFAAAASFVIIIAVSTLLYFSDMGFEQPQLTSNNNNAYETLIRINPDLPQNTLYTTNVSITPEGNQLLIEVAPHVTPDKIKSTIIHYQNIPHLVNQFYYIIDQHFAANESLTNPEPNSNTNQNAYSPNSKIPYYINNYTQNPQPQNFNNGSQYCNTNPTYNPINTTSHNTNFQNVQQDSNNSVVIKNPVATQEATKLPYFALPEYVCSESAYELKPYEINSGFRYIWSTGENTPSIIVRSSGSYTLTIINADNPSEFTTSTSVVNITPKPSKTLPSHTVLCSGQTLNLEPKIDNPENYSYFWIPTYDTTKDIRVKEQGLYVLAITGCYTYFDSVLVTREHCDILVPNVITPNNDGINDYFYIHGLEKYSNTMLTIYDRNGRIVFTSNDYQNDWTGDKLSDGSYYFVLRFSDGLEKHGSLTILK